MLKAFKGVFRQDRILAKLQTDGDKEFLNQSASSVVKQHGIHHLFTSKEVKATILECFNQTLETEMWR